jgi:carboxyl-terminal processing protease
MQNSQKPNKGLNPFSKGLFIVLALGFVFYAGLQFGSGSWSANFSNNNVASNQGLPSKLNYSEVDKIYNDLKLKYDGELDANKLLDGLKKGLVEASGDPYTAYLDAEETNSFNESLSGSFEGIGAMLQESEGYVTIETPLSGFPAEKAGLKARDVIVEIDGQDATGLDVGEAVKRIRGEKGTTVTLKIIRDGEAKEFKIVRETITIPSVETEFTQDNIAVVKINSFDENTTQLFNDTVNEIKSKNVKGIVLDLRNNPGGYLNSSVSVSEKWLKSGNVIVQEKRDGKVVEGFTASKDGPLVGIPTVVLINEGSASASEITAGALKDNGVATLVGVTSYGKGSVQEPVKYSDGSLLKVTVARWYRPNGDNIDQKGIEPDAKVEITEENFTNKQDPQKDKALEILNK